MKNEIDTFDDKLFMSFARDKQKTSHSLLGELWFCD